MNARRSNVVSTTFTSYPLKRVRSTNITVNGCVDMVAYNANTAYADADGTGVYYKTANGTALMPKNDYAGETLKVYMYEPVAIRRGKPTGGPRQRMNKINDPDATLLPVVAAMNGVRGESRADIQAQYRVFGIAELTGRDTAAPGMNILVGGVVPFFNSTQTNINAGDAVMLVPVPQEELAIMYHVPGNGADGENGRAPFRWEKATAESLITGPDVRRCIQRTMYINHAGVLQFCKYAPSGTVLPKYNKYRVTQLLSTRAFDAAVYDYIMGLAAYLDLAAILRAARSDMLTMTALAAMMVFMSGYSAKNSGLSVANANALIGLQAFVDNVEYSDTAHPTAADATVGRAALLAEFADFTGDVHAADVNHLINDPVQKQVRAQFELKRDTEESLAGVVAIGAPPKGFGDILMRSYMH